MPELGTSPTPKKQKLFSWLLPILAFSIIWSWYFLYDRVDGVSVYQDASGKISIFGPAGWPDRWIDSHDPRRIAQTVNLPATLIVVPLELLFLGDSLGRPNFELVGVIEFSLSGSLLWTFVGRFLDDGLLYRKTHLYPRFIRQDYVFAICLIVLTTLAFAACRDPWDWIWFGVWETIGISAWFFRLRQRRHTASF